MNSIYEEWQKEINRILEITVEKRKTKKKPKITAVRKWNKAKHIVKNMKNRSREQKRGQIMIYNDIIEEEIKKMNASRIMNKAKSIKKDNKFNIGAFWEFKRQMDVKKETPTSMHD